MRRNIFGLMAALLTLLLGVVPAQAITYGTPDGNGHPNVVAIIVEFNGQKSTFCSGTLISPTVFLTAAHCTSYLESLGISEVWVTFDSEFTDTSKLVPGTMHTNPGYNQRQSDTGDIAVLVLDRAVRDLTPAKLPTAGLLDRLSAQNGLHGQQFTAVGYGVTESTTGGGPPQFGDNLNRRLVATSTFDALNSTFLRLSQNNATDDGGTCYDDSGGPNFLGTSNLIAAITITGDAQCVATNVDYRLDTTSARTFLGQYVTLP